MKIKLIEVPLIINILLVVSALALQIYDGYVIAENNILKKESEEVKERTEKIIGDIIHGADLSVRGFALTKNQKLAEPLAIILTKKDSIYKGIYALLRKHDYPAIADFQKLKVVVDDYLAFSNQLIAIAERGDMVTFDRYLSEDRGFAVWKQYQSFYEPLFAFEDRLIESATNNYANATKANEILQWLVVLISVPSTFFVIRQLRRESKARTQVLASIEKSNRELVFDPGVSNSKEETDSTLYTFIDLFRRANEFVGAITNEDYEKDWEGLTEQNKTLNENNLAGRLTIMRNHLKNLRTRENQRAWVNEGLTQFSDLIRRNNTKLDVLSFSALSFLCKHLNMQQGAIFIKNLAEGEVYLEMTACYAFGRKKYFDKRIEVGEGIVGQIFLEGNTQELTDIPKNYIHISSGLGEALPTYIIATPLKYDDKIEGVIELASFHRLQKFQIDFIEKCGSLIASAKIGNDAMMITERLLADSQAITREFHERESSMKQTIEELHSALEELKKGRQVN